MNLIANPLERFASGFYDIELAGKVEDARQLAILVRGKTILYEWKSPA